MSQIQSSIWGNEIKSSLDLPLCHQYFNTELIDNKKNLMRQLPLDRVIEILHTTGQLLSDQSCSYYQQAMKCLPNELAFSSTMVAESLAILGKLMDEKALRHRHSYIKTPQNKDEVTLPKGVICHIAPGNIFIGMIDSLLYGLLSSNINIIKISRKATAFLPIFLSALEEVDVNKELIPLVSFVYWGHDQVDVARFFLSLADVVLLFGGEESVNHYRQQLPDDTELATFGPKVSVALVTKGLDSCQLKDCAEKLALDIIMWEQRACTSCQNIFIEKDDSTANFISLLHEALESLGLHYDNKFLSLDDKVDLCRIRQSALFNQFQGHCQLLQGDNSHHTLIVRECHDITPSPLHRTVYINTITNWKEFLKGNIKGYREFLSTLALCCPAEQYAPLAHHFFNMGFSRIVGPGTMSLPASDSEAHDDTYIIRKLVQYKTLDQQKDRTLVDEPHGLLDQLNRLLLHSLNAPFYRNLYKDITLPLTSIEQFKDLPPITQQDLHTNVDQMLTTEPINSYLFSPGGSSGQDKYVWYSVDEFEASQRIFGIGFEEVGIGKGDLAANLMKAGALWTGFLVVNKGLETTGCNILSLTSNHQEEDALDYIEKLRPNVLVGLPGEMILLAQRAEALGKSITIDKIYFGGNHLSTTGRDYLERVFKSTTIKSFGYAAVEIGPIGYQCPHCRDQEFHLFDEWCHVEVGPDQEAYVTTLARQLHPIIRYPLGDRIEIKEELCPCGRHRKLKLLSRSNVMIRLTHSDLYLKDLENIIEQHSFLSPFYQIEITPVMERFDFKLMVESRQEPVGIKQTSLNLKETFIHSVERECEALSTYAVNNLLRNVDIQVVPPKYIPRNSRTGKIRKILDHRI